MSWQATHNSNTECSDLHSPQKEGGFSPEQEGLGKQKESRKDEHLFDNFLYFADAEWVRMKETLIKITIHDTFHL